MNAPTVLISVFSVCLYTGSGWADSPVARHRAVHHRRQTAAPVAQPAAARTPAGPPVAGPAPVPNDSVTAPNPTQAGDPMVAPSVFALHYPPQGEGYVTGSSPQAMDDRNAAKVTGVQMTLPLTQGSEPAPP